MGKRVSEKGIFKPSPYVNMILRGKWLLQAKEIERVKAQRYKQSICVRVEEVRRKQQYEI
jgi:hypothetical protein